LIEIKGLWETAVSHQMRLEIETRRFILVGTTAKGEARRRGLFTELDTEA